MVIYHQINGFLKLIRINVLHILLWIVAKVPIRKSMNTLYFSFYLVQIISAISGGITDLSFNATGYAWQVINCFLTASYSVSIYFGVSALSRY